jgi:hypothetical protein
MGWKISCIIANERQSGYLGTGPGHDEVAGRQMLKKMRILITHTSSHAFFPAELIQSIQGVFFVSVPMTVQL